MSNSTQRRAEAEREALEADLQGNQAEITRRISAIRFARDGDISSGSRIQWSSNVPDIIRDREQEVMSADLAQLAAQTGPGGYGIDPFADMGAFELGRSREAFTEARRAVSIALTDASIILGGKMGLVDLPADRYEGEMPGVVEEAILTLEAGKPLLALGAFGGATRDVAIALGLMPPSARVPRGRQDESYIKAISIVEKECVSMVPQELLPALTELAASDQSEQAANFAVRLVTQWPSANLRPDEPQLFGR